MSKKRPPRPPADRETRVFPPDADREPDFAGPEGPARFSKTPFASPAEPPGQEAEPSPLSKLYGAIPDLPLDLDAMNRGRAAVGMPPLEPAGVVPAGPRGDKGFVFELDALWTGRLHTLANHAGVEPGAYLTALLRRQWTAAPLTAKVPR